MLANWKHLHPPGLGGTAVERKGKGSNLEFQFFGL